MGAFNLGFGSYNNGYNPWQRFGPLPYGSPCLGPLPYGNQTSFNMSFGRNPQQSEPQNPLSQIFGLPNGSNPFANMGGMNFNNLIQMLLMMKMMESMRANGIGDGGDEEDSQAELVNNNNVSRAESRDESSATGNRTANPKTEKPYTPPSLQAINTVTLNKVNYKKGGSATIDGQQYNIQELYRVPSNFDADGAPKGTYAFKIVGKDANGIQRVFYYDKAEKQVLELQNAGGSDVKSIDGNGKLIGLKKASIGGYNFTSSGTAKHANGTEFKVHHIYKLSQETNGVSFKVQVEEQDGSRYWKQFDNKGKELSSEHIANADPKKKAVLDDSTRNSQINKLNDKITKLDQYQTNVWAQHNKAGHGNVFKNCDCQEKVNKAKTIRATSYQLKVKLEQEKAKAQDTENKAKLDAEFQAIEKSYQDVF